MSTPEQPIVSVSWLNEQQHNPTLRIVDVRWYLKDRSGSEEYRKGHIPHAVFLSLEHALCAEQLNAGPGRHPLPSRERFARAMGAAGISEQHTVIAYDDAGGSIAARLWWLGEHFSERNNVRVLDGGLPAWVAAGLPLSTEIPEFSARTFRSVPAKQRTIEKTALHSLLPSRPTVLDARAPERFRGELEPVDARPGHIPTAKNAPWSANLSNGLFRSPQELRAHYEALGVRDGQDTIVYCGSGVTACHDLLALRIAGFAPDSLLLYPGSWSDWARDTELPAETGA